jgi:hypothetical protein
MGSGAPLSRVAPIVGDTMSIASSPPTSNPSAPLRLLLIGNDKEWAIEARSAEPLTN